MKRFLMSLGAILLLASCGTMRMGYKMTFDTTNPAKVKELAQAAVRVIQGRLYALGNPVGLQDLSFSDSGTMINVSVPSGIATQLTEQLVSPVNFAVMEPAPAGTAADLTVEKYGALKGTGITEKQVDVVTSQTSSGANQSTVTITFTPEGQALLKAAYARAQGKFLAVTVRHHLVSIVDVNASLPGSNKVVLKNVPVEFAEPFTDDVNASSHITFASVPGGGK